MYIYIHTYIHVYIIYINIYLCIHPYIYMYIYIMCPDPYCKYMAYILIYEGLTYLLLVL